MKLTPFKKQLRDKNLIRYKGKPPSIELINDCVKKASYGNIKFGKKTFENIYGIVEKTIERYVFGLRGMPTIYWHIFYEFDNLEKFYATFKVRKKRDKKKDEEKVTPISQTNKTLIDAYRERFSQR